MSARFLVMGNGPLHRPKLPGITGIESFGGHTFHTSRWDYDYSGGDADGDLVGLRDKRVAIIGTGATAVQVVPHVAAGRRTALRLPTDALLHRRPGQPAHRSGVGGLAGPGWQKDRMENFTLLTSGGIAEQDLVMDGWTDIIGKLLTRLRDRNSAGALSGDLAAVLEMADFEKMEQIRSRVDAVVADTTTAAALKPWYRQFCKRPCFHDEYLQAFNLDTVSLVDTDGRGVEKITAKGVVAAGQEYEVDCIIFATGFEVGTDYTRRAGYDVVGADGNTLSDTGRTACVPCTACTSMDSPTCSSSGTRKVALRSTTPTFSMKPVGTRVTSLATPSNTSSWWRRQVRARMRGSPP